MIALQPVFLLKYAFLLVFLFYSKKFFLKKGLKHLTTFSQVFATLFVLHQTDVNKRKTSEKAYLVCKQAVQYLFAGQNLQQEPGYSGSVVE